LSKPDYREKSNIVKIQIIQFSADGSKSVSQTIGHVVIQKRQR